MSALGVPDPDAGRARDVALVLLRPSEGASSGPTTLRPLPVTNHRWALSAIGAAAVCTLEPADTVFCAVPLHHPTGLLASAGAALVGGARLALVELDPNASDFAPRLLEEIRRAGATVVFYAGEMLLAAPRREAAALGPPTAGATLRGQPHAQGARDAHPRAVRCRYHRVLRRHRAPRDPRRSVVRRSGCARHRAPRERGGPAPRGRPRAPRRLEPEAAPGEPGLLAVRQDDGEWLVTSDVLRRDEAGRWNLFVDSLSAFVSTPDGPVSLRQLEDALYTLPEVRLAVAAHEAEGIAPIYTSREPIPPERLPALPSVRIERVPDICLTEGFRPRR